MWVFTTLGFFSAVRPCDDPANVRVRARDRLSLEQLVNCMETAAEIHEESDRDYPWRVVVPRLTWALFLAGYALEGLNYPNFKEACESGGFTERQLTTLTSVWATMYSGWADRPGEPREDDLNAIFGLDEMVSNQLIKGGKDE